MNQPDCIVSVILPTYNEAGNIVDLCADLHETLHDIPHECIVVDDNSPDQTAHLVIQAIEKHHWKFVKLVVRTTEQGLANSIQEGIENAQGKIICWMGCNFSMPSSMMLKLVQEIRENRADVAVGSRFVPGEKQKADGKSWITLFLSTILNSMLSCIAGFRFWDFMSGFIAIDRRFIKPIRLHGECGEYFADLIVQLHRNGAKIVELPFICGKRRSGTSKSTLNISTLFSHGLLYLSMCFRILMIRSRPMEGKP